MGGSTNTGTTGEGGRPVEEKAGGGNGFLRILGILAGFALAFVFLKAAILKATDVQLFASDIGGYEMLPESLLLPAAYGLVLFELLLGVWLLLRLLPRFTLWLSGLLLLFFIGATIWAWSHGNAEACGCFGRASSRGPIGVIVEDTIFLALVGISYLFALGTSKTRWRWIVFAIVAPICIALPWIAPKLPIDRWVTPVHRGAVLGDIAVDGLRMSLGHDVVFLGLLGKDCEACDAAIPVMDEIAGWSADEETRKRLPESGVKVAAIFEGTGRETRAFVLEHVPAFPVGHSSEKVLRQYYRELPVFVLMDDGIVVAGWWGEAPTASEVLQALLEASPGSS